MSRNGLEVFDKTVQETNHWLKAMMQELETDDRRNAFTALRAVLHTLRDRIGPANAVHFGAQLPMLLRGAYYEGWRITGTTHEREIEDFIDHIHSHLPNNFPIAAFRVARAGFAVLREMLEPNECEKVTRLLPRDITGVVGDAGTESLLPF